MKLKKVFALLIASTLFFSACATEKTVSESANETETTSKEKPQEDVNKDVKVKLSVQAEKAWIPYYEKAIDRVKKVYPNADISIIEIGVFEHLDVLYGTDATNPDVADVFPFGLDGVEALDRNDNIAEFDAKKIAENIGGFGDYDNSIGGTLKVDDRYLAFPFNIETLVVYTNTENAKNHNIDLVNDIEFNNLKYSDLLVLIHNGWFGVSFTNAVDLDLLNIDDNGKFVSDLTKNFDELSIEQQKMFEALYNYFKANSEAKTDLWDKNASSGYIDKQFATGSDASLRVDGPWAAPALVELTNSGKDLNVIPLGQVKVNGNPLRHWRAGWALGINARVEGDKEKTAVAEQLIQEIVNPEYAVDLFKSTGKILANVDGEKYEASDIGEIDKKVIIATIESYKGATDRIVAKEWDNVWDAWETAILSWSSTKPNSAEEAYNALQSSFESLMNTINAK